MSFEAASIPLMTMPENEAHGGFEGQQEEQDLEEEQEQESEQGESQENSTSTGRGMIHPRPTKTPPVHEGEKEGGGGEMDEDEQEEQEEEEEQQEEEDEEEDEDNDEDREEVREEQDGKGNEVEQDEDESEEEGEEDERGIRKRKAASSLLQDQATPKRPKVPIQTLAKAISDKRAVLRFFRLVHSWREYDQPLKKKLKVEGDELQVMVSLQHLNDLFQQKTAVSRFGDVLINIRRAQLIEHFLGPKSGRRIRTKDLLQEMGRQCTPEALKGLQQELVIPRRWRKICQLDGCVPFLPF
jgi:hypothetical protein